MFKHLSENENITCVHIHGNPETMDVYEYRFFKNGIVSKWEEIDLNKLKEKFKRWALKAGAQI